MKLPDLERSTDHGLTWRPTRLRDETIHHAVATGKMDLAVRLFVALFDDKRLARASGDPGHYMRIVR